MSILRLELQDDWLVPEFAKSLVQVNNAYTKSIRIAALSKAFNSKEFEQRLIESLAKSPRHLRWYEIENLIFPDDKWRYKVLSRKNSLKLSRIQLASPGFVELIGQLNPLKAIFEFITDWRSENTKRQENTAANRRFLIAQRVELVKELLDKLNELKSDQRDRLLSALISGIEQEIVDDWTSPILHIAESRKVESVKLLDDNEVIRDDRL